MAQEKENNKGNNSNSDNLRPTIAQNIIKYSLIGIFGYAVLYLGLIFFKSEKDLTQTAQTIFNALLPLIGTWVGTVIAYYFSKDNFNAASNSVSKMVDKLSPMQKLTEINATSEMIAKSNMEVYSMPKGKSEKDIFIVNDILKLLEEKKRNRLPILDENDYPKYIIHRSILDKYLTRKTVAGKTKEELERLTLDDILNDSEDNYKEIFSNAFWTLKENDSMADAKYAIDRMSNCLDVFITKDGTKKSPVVGWLTNLIITKCAQIC